ncbi:uncharacterized protein N7515_000883 [Penicillium bovifimosum]|uniref:Uncharacterized protein n=1 Tax=Penicillium bovifimosum TaxID=126998 RepID=A0A9W9LAA4_9EURO|nr:uncharacterized protein N7515_000883 [Penicillium bovifimosum]KAJ5146319.1 hypothetical protein N7515_000883 [Penicillium bovifimosum]
MRFNVAGVSALLALTASAMPVAKRDVEIQTVWQTVYETVYQTVHPAPTANANPVQAMAIPSTTEAVAVPTTTSIPTLSVPAPTVPAVSSTLSPSTTSSAPVATGSGVSIVNNLDHTVYLWVVTDTPGEMTTLASGETFNDQWLTNSNGGGISIKISTTEVCDDVLQFEYTQSGDVLFWDLSSINMQKTSAFVKAGFGVTISDESCPTATCAPGDAYCVQSYQLPDDVNTLACGVDAAYTLTLG